MGLSIKSLQPLVWVWVWVWGLGGVLLLPALVLAYAGKPAAMLCWSHSRLAIGVLASLPILGLGTISTMVYPTHQRLSGLAHGWLILPAPQVPAGAR